eukprot:925235-Prorocentrum_minimum.AAC.3
MVDSTVSVLRPISGRANVVVFRPGVGVLGFGTRTCGHGGERGGVHHGQLLREDEVRQYHRRPLARGADGDREHRSSRIHQAGGGARGGRMLKRSYTEEGFIGQV